MRWLFEIVGAYEDIKFSLGNSFGQL